MVDLAGRRLATIQENNWNRGPRSNNKSGVKGVHWSKALGKWRAVMEVGGRQLHIGLFNDKTTAAAAYQATAVSYHGEFAFMPPGFDVPDSLLSST